jgi:D-sedoheptulose 7-phosphate isomerase
LTGFADEYYEEMARLVGAVSVTDGKKGSFGLGPGVEEAGSLILERIGAGAKLIFIGNGGSAAICSHMAIDFWKNAGMRALVFNDGPQLTCLGNDYGYEHVFEKPVGMFADEGDILVAISSSGRSENIHLGVEAARSKGSGVITLSGFREDNLLRSMGDINFYVSSGQYGHVEVIHHSICHCILDFIMQNGNKD